MNTTYRTALAALIALVSAYGSVQAQTTTAQSIMIDLSEIPTNLAVVGTESYEFNAATAATYFTNVWDGNTPTVTWTSKGSSTEAGTLAVPPAPAPDASVIAGTSGGNGKEGLAGKNKCNFLNGGTLTSETYTQKVQVTLGSASTARTYTYTYTFNATPNGPVAPFTAWDLKNSTVEGAADVDLVAKIAGESVAVSKQLPNGKYSFSLLASDGTIRVGNVGVSVDGSAFDYTGLAAYTDRSDDPTLNFNYTANAGTYGKAIASLKIGDAVGILNGDSFLGNNDGGSDGKALAAVNLSGLVVSLTPGTHTITVKATVKGNISSEVPVTVSQTVSVNIITPGCGGN